MLEFYTETKPKARKQHKCDLCGKTIEPGEKYHCFTGKYDGKMFTDRTCLPCSGMISAYCDKCEHGGWADDDCEYLEEDCPHIRQHFTEREESGNE